MSWTRAPYLNEQTLGPLAPLQFNASFQRESRFTTSEILLQRLASKQCWTESELSEVIDLLKSRHFRVGDIGLDLTRKVRRSYAISYYFDFISLIC